MPTLYIFTHQHCVSPFMIHITMWLSAYLCPRCGRCQVDLYAVLDNAHQTKIPHTWIHAKNISYFLEFNTNISDHFRDRTHPMSRMIAIWTRVMLCHACQTYLSNVSLQYPWLIYGLEDNAAELSIPCVTTCTCMTLCYSARAVSCMWG